MAQVNIKRQMYRIGQRRLPCNICQLLHISGRWKIAELIRLKQYQLNIVNLLFKEFNIGDNISWNNIGGGPETKGKALFTSH